MNRTEQRTGEPHRSTSLSLFDQAAKVFDGWTDPDTGMRVLRISVRGDNENVLQTPYHQCRIFLDGGRKVLLHHECFSPGQGGFRSVLLDLATGGMEDPVPPGYYTYHVIDRTNTAYLMADETGRGNLVIRDLRDGRDLAAYRIAEGTQGAAYAISDGRRGLVTSFQGRIHVDPIRTQIYLIAPDEPPRLVLEEDGYYCNHVQSCPTNPELFAYDRWPSPLRDIEQAITLATLDGAFREPLKMDDAAMRPVCVHGVRDHYLWTPDGNRIVSYLCPHRIEITPDFDHFKLEWWLSATDWRTGEDLAAKYPPGRFGGHMGVSPDSRHIVCAGGPGFDKLFAVSIDGLRAGWNERVICSYPKTVSTGKNSDPFPYPFALPDGSGVIFNAGWPGPEHGVYLAEWPGDL